MKTTPSLFLIAVAAFVNIISQVDSISLTRARHNTVKVHSPWFSSERRDVPPLSSPLSSLAQMTSPRQSGTKSFYDHLYRTLIRQEEEVPVVQEPYYGESYEPRIEDFGFMRTEVPSFSSDLDIGSDMMDEANKDDEEEDVISPQTRSLISRIMNGEVVKRHN